MPIPLHWSRMIKRRYNQSALLVKRVAPKLGCDVALDALVRPRRTQPLERVTLDERFARLSGAISVHPGRAPKLAGRHVVIVDDVMTSGATLGAATEACLAAGARQVDVLVLARVCKDD